jgi:NAD(P)-dependent dehydrogenase (short-subunit alcohol dehydrogenase family)
MREIRGMSLLITGGGSGIGESTARYFVKHGARVTITGRREEKLQAVAQSIGDACHYVAGDVTSAEDRHRMLAGALEHGGRLDSLVNNAANMYRQPADGYTEGLLREAFDTNVISAMMLSSAAIEFLVESKGSIIFIGSTHTRRAFPGASPYAATKAALEGLTKVMAAELGPRQVRVSCVLPGAVITELNVRAGIFGEDEIEERYREVAKLHALGRVGTSEEIAESVAHLVCAEWVTGVTLEVDGGISLGVSQF